MDQGLTELRASLSGDALAPGDDGYDAARVCFNALIDREPAVIARCVDTGDIATAFGFARERSLKVAVRGGGHNPAGHCVLDGGLVIDLSRMRKVEVDENARTARSQGGATWLDFDAATQAHGLVTPGGVVGSTGVAGLTFGGGIGHLTAQLGLTCDNLVGAELVTPAGEAVRASADENAELLWGLRGGGGNFGVATVLTFRLHPVEQVVGGRLNYGGDGVAEALRAYRDLVGSDPRDLSCQAILDVDESGAPALVIAPCYTGSDADPGELRALRVAPGLVDDGVRPHTFLEQQLLFDSAYGENRKYWKGHFVRELPGELIDELLRRMVALGRPPGEILIESLHGAPKHTEPGHGGARLPRRRLQRQRDGELDGPRPRSRVHPMGSRDRGRDRALVGQRRLHQLHAGRRADRARPRRLRRPGLRAPPSVEEALRPGQRPAPKPEHPALISSGPGGSGRIRTANG